MATHSTADTVPLQQHYNEAQTLQQTGKLTEAAEQYRAFLADALGELAIGYALVPDYSQAAPLFDEALALEPDSASLLLDYARTALVLGDLDHARTLASEFIQKYPGDRVKLAQAHQLLGRALLKLNRDQEARKELEAAVALDPTFPNGYDLAVACLDLDDEKCAVQIFHEMETSFGDTAEIHMAFGRAYGDSDFQPRAVTEFRRAIEENPRLPGVHYLLAAVLLATGSDADPLESAEAELEEGTGDLSARCHDVCSARQDCGNSQQLPRGRNLSQKGDLHSSRKIPTPISIWGSCTSTRIVSPRQRPLFVNASASQSTFHAIDIRSRKQIIFSAES